MRVVGLMSGTSADAIDAALAEISGAPERPHMRQLAFLSVPWPRRERARIESLIANRGDTRALSQAGFRLGECLAEAALRVVHSAGITAAEVDLIGSHGQTVWHEVAGDGSVQSTLQVGEAAVIAERSGITTVADFRVADVAAGGQGAPLVPIFDLMFLRPAPESGGCRAVQNIGGIGNVTFLPPRGSSALPLAFDTGPGNVLIDWAAAQASKGAQAYDVDGKLAAQGRRSEELVARWLSQPYFSQRPPKSTGRELYNNALAEQYRAEAAAAGLCGVDFVATLTDLTAASIADSYRRFAPLPVSEVIICGGGAHNPTLLARIREQLVRRGGKSIEVVRYGDLGGVPGDEDSKEALCFALLAWLTIQAAASNVPACTGAEGARVLGKIAPGRNFRQLTMKVWGSAA